MKIVLNLCAFLLFSHLSIGQTLISDFGRFIFSSKPWTYVYGTSSNSDINEVGSGFGFEDSFVQLPIDVADSIVVNSIFELIFCKDGKIGIGTGNPDKELTVKGKIHSREVKLDLNFPVPDYVFEDDYNLMPLSSLAEYIFENGHLPDVPSADEFRINGLNMAEMDMMLLKKVEELTLYVISNNDRLNILDSDLKDSITAIDLIEKMTRQLGDLEKQFSSAKD